MIDRSLVDRLEEDVEAAETSPGEVDLEQSIDALDSPERTVRRPAIRVLAVLATADPNRVVQAVPALIDRLEDEDMAIRNLASRTVAVVADAEPDAVVPHVSEVTAALKDEYVHVQRYAALALSLLAAADPAATADAAEPLADLADHEIRLIGHSATSALASIAGERPAAVAPVAPTLLTVLAAESRQPSPTDRAAGQRPAGGQFEAPDSIEQLATQERIVRSRNTDLAAAALSKAAVDCPDAVTEALTPYAERLRSLLDRDDQTILAPTVGVLAYMAEDSPTEARPATDRLIELLDSDDRSIAGNAAWTLHYLNTKPATEALEHAGRTHGDDEVRALSRTLLDEMDDAAERTG